ncbi:MAG: hypothetical protein L6Q81_06950 [Bacteroidia bacterium]|nr:hypothetical protein [Bacteroidia bacterium]
MKGLKTIVGITLVIGLLLCLAALLLYYYNFRSQQMSSDPDAWGVFGDYLGGTLNPILGLTNLALLVIISVYVAKFDTYRHFNEYRYQSYTKLCSMFDNAPDTAEGIAKLNSELEIFAFNNQFLFPKNTNPIFNASILQLEQRLRELRNIKADFESKVASGDIQVIHLESHLGVQLEAALANWPGTETEESIALKSFSEAKKHLLGFIQEVMVEGDYKKYTLDKKKDHANGVQKNL